MTIKGKGAAQIKLQAAGIDAICTDISCGATLHDCAKKYKISFGTLAGFLSQPENIDKYTRAREAKVELMVDNILEVANNLSGDTNRDRLRIDTMKWLASKIMPRNYGDKTIISGDSANPLTINILRFSDGDDKPAE